MGIIKDFLGQSEASRQAQGQDDEFYRRRPFFFELFVPNSMGGGPYLFPLMLNPQSYTLDEPFTVQSTPTQGGGLYVEENGIVQRMLNIKGTTGVKPRPLRANARDLLKRSKEGYKSYGRQLPDVPLSVALSGQRHFQYLQDAVFRTYADLKADPSTSEETRLLFHIPKDDEHWIVVPQKFMLSRSKDSPVTYTYDIQLLVVGPANKRLSHFSEDKNWMDAVKSVQRLAQSGVRLVTGALNDLTALSSELIRLIRGFDTIVGDVETALDAASNFVTGTTDLIETPFSSLDSTILAIESAMETRESIEQAIDDIRKLPATTRQKFRQVVDGLERLMTHPESFETPPQKEARENKQRQELALSVSVDTLNTALETAPPSTLDDVENLGTTITQGDALSSDYELGVARAARDYASTFEVDIGQGDSLVSLAATHLGDARLWQDIALVNGLKPPFVDELASINLDSTDETPFADVLGVGGKILIPSYAPPPQSQPQLPVLGVRPEEPAENHLLGTDFLLEQDPNSRDGAPLFDIPIDTDRGSTDARLVSGIANMGQAIGTRLRTQKGTDVLYKQMGRIRIIGTSITAVNMELSRFRITEAIEQDPRVQTVREIALTNAESPESSNATDRLEVDAVVALRGFTQNANIRTTL